MSIQPHSIRSSTTLTVDRLSPTVLEDESLTATPLGTAAWRPTSLVTALVALRTTRRSRSSRRGWAEGGCSSSAATSSSTREGPS